MTNPTSVGEAELLPCVKQELTACCSSVCCWFYLHCTKIWAITVKPHWHSPANMQIISSQFIKLLQLFREQTFSHLLITSSKTCSRVLQCNKYSRAGNWPCYQLCTRCSLEKSFPMGRRWQCLLFTDCEGVQTISSVGDESSLMLPNRNSPNYIQHWLCFLVQEDTVLIIWQFFILIATKLLLQTKNVNCYCDIP